MKRNRFGQFGTFHAAFFLSSVLVLCGLLAAFPTQAKATTKTADEAIAWAQSKVGEHVGYDDGSGYYQCVEFIQAYYKELGVSQVSGNGCDYSWNALPDGWTRTAGGVPQKGDILVYGSSSVSSVGHVAIYESDNSLYDQDGSKYGATVEHHESNYLTYTPGYWGCIHPNFRTSSIVDPPEDEPTPTPGWTRYGTCEYKITGDTLTYRPLGNGASGTLESNQQLPEANNQSVNHVVVQSGVRAGESLRDTFRNCSNLVSIDLSGLDTSNVTNMHGMFYGCSSLSMLDVSSFDTSKVTDMDSMFYGCSALTMLDVSNFDTSNVKDMGEMFRRCSSLVTLDLSSFDTSKVTLMWDMFVGCSSLTSLEVSNFDTSKVWNMEDMFFDCSSLFFVFLYFPYIHLDV